MLPLPSDKFGTRVIILKNGKACLTAAILWGTRFISLLKMYMPLWDMETQVNYSGASILYGLRLDTNLKVYVA